MKFTKLICVALIAASGAIGGANAQSFRGAETPAEYPPASYKGNQYVDSRGCVYIRAGVNGNISWVPRVSRERKPVCGMQPTQVSGTTTAPAAPEGVEQITLDAPAAASAPKPAPVPVAQPAPAPAPVVRRAAPAPVPVPAVAPVVVAAAPEPNPAPATAAPVVQTRTPACTGASRVSQRYINAEDKGGPVRCGPQSVPHSTPLVVAPQAGQPVARQATRQAASATSNRVVPAHIAQERVKAQTFTVPKGYRSAWTDDRLNPRRAEGTVEGWSRMQLIWTNTLPRRLIDQTSGRDVTANVALVYPYTNVATQERELGKVTLSSRNGQVVKRVQRNPGAPSLAQLAKRTNPAAAASRPVTADAPKGETLAGKRYVQVGTFAVPSNAQATAQRLQRTGLPVRIGTLARSGTTYRLVLAGPFADDASAQQALRAARKAGFKDAYLRR